MHAKLVAAVWAIGMGIGNDAGAASSLEPCSILTEAEASRILKGKVKREVPSPIQYRGTTSGGTCTYRSQQDGRATISVRSDATPTAAQKQQFEGGQRRTKGIPVAGLGDRAYAAERSSGIQTVVVLRGEVLATITVDGGLTIDDAKRVAAIVAPRLPEKVVEPPAAPPSPAATSKLGNLDGALVGSWFIQQRDGRGIANLRVEDDGRFYITLLAGNRQQSGRMDGENGVLHMYPERGGSMQTIRYRVIDKSQLEWTDDKGNVTLVKRQFR